MIRQNHIINSRKKQFPSLHFMYMYCTIHIDPGIDHRTNSPKAICALAAAHRVAETLLSTASAAQICARACTRRRVFSRPAAELAKWERCFSMVGILVEMNLNLRM